MIVLNHINTVVKDEEGNDVACVGCVFSSKRLLQQANRLYETCNKEGIVLTTDGNPHTCSFESVHSFAFLLVRVQQFVFIFLFFLTHKINHHRYVQDDF